MTLADFDHRLMDGFTFCKKVYRLLNEVYAGQDGVKRPRDRLTKKLTEELPPLTHYVRSRYTKVASSACDGSMAISRTTLKFLATASS